MATLLLAAVALSAYLVLPQPEMAIREPVRYTDAGFWALVKDLSEPAGFFRSNNFVSNEVPYQSVIPELRGIVGTGGVYLGVGPDQNYTYIAATRPRLAFILDIRRQNMLQDLLYKSIFELYADRVEFLSRLFSRPMPAGLTTETPSRKSSSRSGTPQVTGKCLRRIWAMCSTDSKAIISSRSNRTTRRPSSMSTRRSTVRDPTCVTPRETAGVDGSFLPMGSFLSNTTAAAKTTLPGDGRELQIHQEAS